MMARCRSCRPTTSPQPGEPIRRRCPISSTEARSFRAGAPPKSVVHLALVSLALAFTVIALSWLTLFNVREALAALEVQNAFTTALLLLLAVAACYLLWPACRCLNETIAARIALRKGGVIDARVRTASARNLAWIAYGYAAAQLLLLLTIEFLIANNLAVSRVFLYLPLIGSSFTLILRAFWVNVYIFTVSEILVLIWGLAVALARLAPGPAGRPLRLIATFYVDVFRGLPAIINIYLIGFGIPLTGLPIVKEFSQQSFAILALVLTNGAYVAEVYRAGIESIHFSQTAAARSLGLSHLQTLRYVIIPQGVRHIIPPLLNNFIGLQKETALVNVIGTIDAFNQSIIVASNNFNLSAVTTVAALFIVITIPQARLVDRLVERDRRRMRAGAN